MKDDLQTEQGDIPLRDQSQTHHDTRGGSLDESIVSSNVNDAVDFLRTADVNQVGKQLVALQIVSAGQWKSAVRSVKNPASLDDVLQELTNASPTWSNSNGPQFNALSQYQYEQIADGQIDSLKLGHYIILDHLGQGGMGEVYLGRNQNMPQLAAIKVLLRDIAGTASMLATDVDRFDREAKLMAQLNHPNITTIYHYGHEKGLSYIAMEYVHGETLSAYVERENPVRAEWALSTTRQVADALKHAHVLGIIHRDIKPDNIMITLDGRIKVLDMGIAKLTMPTGGTESHAETSGRIRIGTPSYMPPEQWIDGRDVSEASDIYSLGCTLFYTLSGTTPFKAPSLYELCQEHTQATPPTIGSVRKDAKSIDPLIARMLAKNPSNRFANCDRLIEAIDALGDGKTSRTRWSGQGQPMPSRGRRVSRWALSIGLGLATAGFLMWLVLHKSPRVPSVEPHGIEVGSEVSSVFADYPDVWTSTDSVQRYAEQLTVDATLAKDTAAIREALVQESQRRQRQRTELLAWLDEILQEHDMIWRDRDELERFLQAATPKDCSYSPEDVASIRQSVTEEIEERWQEAFDRRLEVIQTRHSGLWETTNSLRSALAVQSDWPKGIRDKQQFEQWLARADAISYRRRWIDWAASYTSTHDAVWTDASIPSEWPETVIDKSSFEEMRERMEGHTHDRAEEKCKTWLTAFQQRYPELWAGTEEIIGAIDGVRLADVTTKAAFEQFVDRVHDIAARRLHGKWIPTDDPEKNFHADTAREVLEWLARLQSTPKDPDWKLEVETVVGTRRTNRVVGGGDLGIRVRTSKAGYPTLLAHDAEGKLVLVRWTQELPANQWTDLLSTESDPNSARGTDKLFIFVTSENPVVTVASRYQHFQQPVESAPAGTFAGFLFPFSSLSAADVQRLADGYQSPTIFGNLLRAIETSKSFPFLKAPAGMQWTRFDFEVLHLESGKQ